MKQIVIISGKGGTGKTTVSAALADLAAHERKLVLADADVDASNLELLLQPSLVSRTLFESGQTVTINQQTCLACGLCEQVCRFDAVITHADEYSIDPHLCEGCLACLHQCPAGAISAQSRQTGEWYQSTTEYGALFHARLIPGEENSGKLVAEIIDQARQNAAESRADVLLVDGPPGVGCPVTAALRSADLVVLVSEPTVSGKHDLERVLEITRHFKLPARLVLNKSNLSQRLRREILDYTESERVGLLGEIPYDESAISALITGRPITSLGGHALKPALIAIWEQLRKEIG
ncbi:MAG: ATP-binding protein [Chloroflexota bacterium]